MSYSNLRPLSTVWLANMYPVPPPDTHHLNATIGWLALGDLREAGLELRRISKAFRHHPDVLAFRLDVWAEQGQWRDVVRLAEMLMEVQSHTPAGTTSGELSATTISGARFRELRSTRRDPFRDRQTSSRSR